MQRKGSSFRLRDLFRFAVYVLLGPLILFLAAGRLDWWQAWAYIGVTYTAIIGSRLLVLRRHPDMLKERAQSLDNAGVKSWDRVLVPLLTLVGPALVMLTAGLDQRWQWSDNFSPILNIIGLVGLAAGSAFSTWAMVVNQFFSAQVRIQQDRGHYVIDAGPYRIVRHPGYAGGLLGTLLIPLVLGSWWAFLPTAVLLVIYIMRTSLEDRTLRDELPGYAEYSRRTRFRLVPGVW